MSYVYPVLPKVSWSISNLFSPALTVCCRCILSGISGIPDIV